MNGEKPDLSIIVPAYNARDVIGGCLKSIMSLDRIEMEVEVILVDDASVDHTADIAKEILPGLRIIRQDVNSGRAVTRRNGALAASAPMLLFIDARVRVHDDLLVGAKRIPGAMIQIPAMDDPGPGEIKGLFDGAFASLRALVYRSAGHEMQIREDNFDRCRKGTTCFMVPRDVFLDSYEGIDLSNRHVNDDTAIMRNMVKKGHVIERNPYMRIIYLQRNGFAENARHMYERGPRWVDYYYGRHDLYTLLIRLSLAAMAVWLIVLAVSPVAAGMIFMALFVFYLVFGMLAGRGWKGKAGLILCMPVIAVSFGAGVIKGLARKFQAKRRT